MKNNNYSNKIKTLIVALTLGLSGIAQTVSTFEDITLSGKNNAKIPDVGLVNASFTSGSFEFRNSYDIGFGGYWNSGWAYSKVTDTITEGLTNLYGSFANTGYDSSNNYAVAQDGAIVKLKNNTIKGVYISNATYAALSMKKGDAFAKKFGGATGNDTDWFKITVNAFKNGSLKPQNATFYLADFRSANNTEDYIVKDWTYLDLVNLGDLDSLQFALSSSDNNQFGMKTPAFFCIDNVITNADTATFESLNFPFGQKYWNRGSKTFTEVYQNGNASFSSTYSVSPSFNSWSKGFAISNYTDSTTEGFTNIYASANGKGAKGSSKYAMSANNTIVKLTNNAIGKRVAGVYVNNGAYAYFSMLKGDAFAKKFGGSTANDTDWFRINIKAWYNGNKLNDSVLFYLADFRFADNSKDYILKTWAWVDLAKLGNVDSLQFKLESSDVGQFGMNTPAYFAIDDFTTLNSGVGIASINTNNSLSIYPNPSTNFIYIDANEKMESVQIYNMAGQEVLNTENAKIDISSLNTGVYGVSVITSNGIIRSKFIKQ